MCGRHPAVRTAVVILGIVLAWGAQVSAAFYYVSPTGSDTASGSSTEPFATINKGVSVLTAGDTLLLNPGTYYQQGDLGPLGTPASAVTIKAVTKGTAVIRPGVDNWGLGALTPVGNLVLDGLAVGAADCGIRFDNATNLTIRNCEVYASYRGLWVRNGAHVLLRKCHLHGNRHSYLFGFDGTALAGLTLDECVAVGNAQDGESNTDGFLIESACSNVVITDSLSTSNGDSGFDVKPAGARVERCRAYSNWQVGFKFWSANALLANCLAYRNHAYGAVVGGNGMRLFQCTLADNGGYSLQVDSPQPSTVIVRNCLLTGDAVNIMTPRMYNDNCNLYYVAGRKQPMIWVGMKLYRYNALTAGQRPLGPDSLLGNPLYKNPAAGDYSLQAGSPAIGQGVWNGAVCTLDLLGRARASGLPTDLGALKYVPAAAPAAPASLALQATALPAAGGAQVQIRTSVAAQVAVSIRNLAGREVAVLSERPVAAGSSTLLWNGRAAGGVLAPRGVYLAVVTARTAGGESASALARVVR